MAWCGVGLEAEPLHFAEDGGHSQVLGVSARVGRCRGGYFGAAAGLRRQLESKPSSESMCRVGPRRLHAEVLHLALGPFSSSVALSSAFAYGMRRLARCL